jgi:hypothetical protein
MIISTAAYALIGTLGVSLIGAVVSLYNNRINRLKIQELEIEVKDLSYTYKISLDSYREVDHSIKNLCDITPIDNFLMLKAFNGDFELRHVSAVDDLYKENGGLLISKGNTVKYKNLDTDAHYRLLLNNTEKFGYVKLFTKDLPDTTLLKNIYINEGVVESYIFFVGRIEIDKQNHVIHFYSLATRLRQLNNREENILFTSADSITHSIKEGMIAGGSKFRERKYI